MPEEQGTHTKGMDTRLPIWYRAAKRPSVEPSGLSKYNFQASKFWTLLKNMLFHATHGGQRKSSFQLECHQREEQDESGSLPIVTRGGGGDAEDEGVEG